MPDKVKIPQPKLPYIPIPVTGRLGARPEGY